MPPSQLSEVVEEMSDLAKAPKKITLAAAMEFGVGTILCVAAAITVWGAYQTFVAEATADARSRLEKESAESQESNAFIRDQLIKQNERQGRMIALATKAIENGNAQLALSTEQLKANSELMRATQACLQECVGLYRELIRLMEKVAARLEAPTQRTARAEACP